MEIRLLDYPSNMDWLLCKRCALVTIGKTPLTEPNSEWKHSILEARHSPIRVLNYCYEIKGIPTWVATHLVRHHEGFQPFVRSQRNDRQSDYDRTKAPQDAPVDMIIYLNAEALMTLANKRLCSLAAKETQEVVREMCRMAESATPELKGLLVPMCEHNGGVCHEMKSCGKCAKQ